jgi:hypothetical protein
LKLLAALLVSTVMCPFMCFPVGTHTALIWKKKEWMGQRELLLITAAVVTSERVALLKSLSRRDNPSHHFA